MGTREKRRYTKRDCSHWGHDYKFTGVVIGVNGKELGWCYTCTRCRASVVDSGLTDRNMSHLFGIPLKDLPEPIVELGQSYEFLDIYK